jgi:deazaflavin-dependent oxidoreductase (nitroreductase family)
LSRFNKTVTNRLTRPFARHLGGFGVVRHEGRRSGTIYETPVNCWITGDAVTIALTYGSEVDWLKNLQALDGGEIIIKGTGIRVGGPKVLSTSDGMSRMPPLPRFLLPWINVSEFREFPILSSG